MSQINLDFAELGLEQDVVDLVYYEASLKKAWDVMIVKKRGKFIMQI